MEQNVVSWFEIPVLDMDRAVAFYNKVFNINIQVQDFGGILMGWFPYAEGKEGASGSLIKNEAYKPSETHGAVIYFGSQDVQNEIDRVEEAGGKIIQPKTQISPKIGYMGLFIDSEGNRIALHSKA